MMGVSPRGSHCQACGASVDPPQEQCPTCAVLDRWQLAVETGAAGELARDMRGEDVVLVVRYIDRLKERRPSRQRGPKRRTSGEFDFALQEIEKTARGLELTSIEAVGVLEVVKQSFVEEMLYDDCRHGGGLDGEEEDGDEGGDARRD